MAAARTRIVYSDLDGTLLGLEGSIFKDALGLFTMAGVRALEMIARNGAQLSFVSGRSARLLNEDARVLGAGSFIAEAGCLVVRDEKRRLNCAPFGTQPGVSVYDEISATGAPDLLFERYRPALAYHAPWHLDHEYTHLMRGCIDTEDVNRLLLENGLNELKVVDNGVIEDQGYGMPVSELHAYHLMPRRTSKGSAIELDLDLCGLRREEAVACGDSDQDMEMAPSVRTLYLMSNARTNCSCAGKGLVQIGKDNVVIVSAPMVEGFLEAMRMEFREGPQAAPDGGVFGGGA